MHHNKETGNVMWPSIISDTGEAERISRNINRSTWVEIGISNKSLMPYCESQSASIIFEKKRWVCDLLEKSSNDESRKIYLALKNEHVRKRFDIIALQEMAAYSWTLDDDVKTGTALFITWATGGSLFNMSTRLDRGVVFSNIFNNSFPTIYETKKIVSYYPVQDFLDDEKVLRIAISSIEKSYAENTHVNVNWTSMNPGGERIKQIGDSLTGRGFSWSFMFTDRHTAKEISEDNKIYKIDNFLYVINTNEQ
jgi:hypothetical protein